jgi:glycine C-acetyltransferase
MNSSFHDHLTETLSQIKADGIFKEERLIGTPQGGRVKLDSGREVIVMCANNYLGLGNHPAIVAAAHEALERWGYGMGSVRFICGTQTLHRQLEEALSELLGTEDTILYSSCFDANGGLFETILTDADAVISDALNHASIIDGIRLCKAKRYRYQNRDMEDLETQLKAAQAAGARFILIATDGVFSMDGTYAPMQKICDLADQYGALVMMDDSHAVGFVGENGRGTHEQAGVLGRVDIITGTLGKALGGASGGYTSGKREIIQLLRQRSRPYLFSNTLAPTIAAATLKAIELLRTEPALRTTLWENTHYYAAGMRAAGFEIGAGNHPIIPIMLGDAKVAQSMATSLLEKGVYAVGFFFPVVPQGKARIRTQISSALTKADLDEAIQAFAACRAALVS